MEEFDHFDTGSCFAKNDEMAADRAVAEPRCISFAAHKDFTRFGSGWLAPSHRTNPIEEFLLVSFRTNQAPPLYRELQNIGEGGCCRRRYSGVLHTP